MTFFQLPRFRPNNAPKPHDMRLTLIQSHVLLFIINHIQDNHSTPTLWDICHKFEYKSTFSAREHLNALKDKGWISIEKGNKIRLLKHTVTVLSIN